jgi:hypothetical protein
VIEFQSNCDINFDERRKGENSKTWINFPDTEKNQNHPLVCQSQHVRKEYLSIKNTPDLIY